MIDVNGAIVDGLTKVVEDLGRPGDLEPHADDLRRFARELQEDTAALDGRVARLTWSGPDADAHRAAWQQQREFSRRVTQLAEETAEVVGGHAADAEALRRRVVQTVLEIVEILLLGVLASAVFGVVADLLFLARAAPLIAQVVRLVNLFRTGLARFAESMREAGTVAGRVGDAIESLLTTHLPQYARSYAGYYVGSNTPTLLSEPGQVDWGRAAWQVALFTGADAVLGRVWTAVEKTPVGRSVQEAISGRPRPRDEEAHELSTLGSSSSASSRTDGAETSRTSGELARYRPAGTGESLYAGLKTGVNTAVANPAVMATSAAVDGKPLSAEQVAADAALSFLLAGARQAAFSRLPTGERLAHFRQPTDAPAAQRLPAELPLAWSHFAVYRVLKDAGLVVTGVEQPAGEETGTST